MCRLLPQDFSLLNFFGDAQKRKLYLCWILLRVPFLRNFRVETPLKDGEVLSASGARRVETGIRVFYSLAIIALRYGILWG